MHPPKPKVLLLGEIEHSPSQEAYDELSSLATLVKPTATNRAEFLQECRSGALDGVKVIYRTFFSLRITGLIDGDVVGALGKERLGVGFLCHCGAGYDQVDISACTAAGIRVSNVPTAVDAATADTAIFLLLGALRAFSGPLIALRQGVWRSNPPPPLGHDPEGKLLGIVGMGGIGRDFKKKAEALGMRVQYYNRKELQEDLAGGASYVGLEDLLRTSDVISLNLPLNTSTHHFISKAEFSQMKTGVVIINTARGAIIDEVALVEALDSGKVFSCGLDVFEDEPEVHPGLVGNEKVMLLPHLGTYSVETQTKMELWNIANVRAALETGKLKSPVAEQADMV